MNRLSLIVLIVLLLPACATHTAKGDSLASDLDAYAANVKRVGKPVMLPNGKDYCAELARTDEQQDACTGDLEDGLYQANKIILNLVWMGVQFTERLRLQRDPCNLIERAFTPSRCQPKNSATPP